MAMGIIGEEVALGGREWDGWELLGGCRYFLSLLTLKQSGNRSDKKYWCLEDAVGLLVLDQKAVWSIGR